jgi:uncharacterized protein (DUF2141 family)
MKLLNLPFYVKPSLYIMGVFVVIGMLSNGCSAPVDLPDSSDAIATDDTCNTSVALLGQKPLILIINNLASPNSPINVVVYQAANKFLSKTDRFKKYKYNSDSSTFIAQINNLSYGEFAIATYQDVNKDGVCNRNFMGVPKEPYGFSNDFKPTIKPPKFKDCQFTYNENADTLTLSMIR